MGGDSHSFFLPPAPAFSGAEEASEMAEVYLHALTRDVSFDEYGTDPVAAFAVNELNAFSDFRGPRISGTVTPKTLFRGSFAGDLAGNDISQFLLKDVPYGATVIPQRDRTTLPGDEHMVPQADWLPAGVHWRTEGTEGILLGADVAVRLLRDAKLCDTEQYDDYTFTGFRGNLIVM